MSSHSRQPVLRRRPTRVVPASITAAVLVVIGVAAVIAAGGRLATGDTDPTVTTILDWLADLHWNGPVLITAAVVVIILGAVLIIAGVRPGRRDALQLATTDSAPQALEAVLPRRALGRLLVSRVEQVDGVGRARADVDERRIVIQATTATRYTDDVNHQISAVVQQALAETRLRRTPRFRVIVRQA